MVIVLLLVLWTRERSECTVKHFMFVPVPSVKRASGTQEGIIYKTSKYLDRVCMGFLEGTEKGGHSNSLSLGVCVELLSDTEMSSLPLLFSSRINL